MTKVQLELDENENEIVGLYKVKDKIKTKQEVIKKMIRVSKNRIAKEIQDGIDQMEI